MGLGSNMGNDPMRNMARITNLTNQQIENDRKQEITGKQRIMAYVGMGILVALLIGIILLFILL